MKKLFTFLCLLMLTLSSAWAQEKSALMQEAEALAADADAVAVGKLIAAIDYATTNADESQLQDAVDQFKADNADQEKDETAKVAVDWTKWAGANGFATWAAPQVTTYDGRTTYVVENYNGGSGSVVGEDYYGKEYMVGSNDGETLSDIVFQYDSEAQTLAQVTAYIAENADKTELQMWGRWTNVTLTAGEPAVLEPITVPSDLVTETYRLTAYDTYFDEDVSRDVEVGFYGTNEVYFKGLSEYTDDDNWVVGTIDSDGEVTIPETFIGANSSLFGGDNIFFPATTFTYDAETETFVCPTCFTTFDKDGNDWDELENVVLTKQTEREATPADPSIDVFALYDYIKESDTELQFRTYPLVELSIPVVDTEGNPMLTDKLSYVLYIIDASDVQQTLTITQDLYSEIPADMTEIPYNFDDDWDINVGGNPFYLNQDPNEIVTWKKIGVQSIYRGMDIEHRSEIVWYDIQAYIAEMQAELERVTGIDDILADSSRDRIVYDLQGRRVATPTKGLYIINGKKVMLK